MRKYKVIFWLNNTRVETIIQAGDRYQARLLIKTQYSGATNILVQEITLS